MTAVTDAIQVITILKGSAPNNAALLRIADQYIKYAGSAFQPVDPDNPTNEEKAQLFLTILRQQARSVISKQARTQKQAENESSVQTAIEEALTDI